MRVLRAFHLFAESKWRRALSRTPSTLINTRPFARSSGVAITIVEESSTGAGRGQALQPDAVRLDGALCSRRGGALWSVWQWNADLVDLRDAVGQCRSVDRRQGDRLNSGKRGQAVLVAESARRRPRRPWEGNHHESTTFPHGHCHHRGKRRGSRRAEPE